MSRTQRAAGLPPLLMCALAGVAAAAACAPAAGGTQDPGVTPGATQDGAPAPAPAGRSAPAPDPGAGAAVRDVVLDDEGVIRWSDTGEEVTLFGANYALPSSGDYRAAGYLTSDRKRLIDQDMIHFARMGWNGLRVAFWGDWQNADLKGNLIENEHLDLMDYLIARARERGIYILFNPIHTYHAGWPDAMGDSFPGFAAHIPKGELGTDPAAIAAQVNYLRQIMEHVNPYTGVRLADEPSILFVEMINEPVHHPEDLEGSVRYIDALADAVRGTGSDAILFHNVSQDFRIAEAIRRSTVQGASFGWYPTGLNAGHELRGNHLRAADDYPPMRLPVLEGMPKVVYEFDSADQRTGYMYPAMARAYRAGGAQFAAMFAYDMLETASHNLGWQTHYLNLVYTPRKAMSGVIAADVMRRLPRLEGYGTYPGNRSFGPFRVSYEEDLAEMAAPDAFLHAGTTGTVPPRPEALERVAGYGSSPVVDYPGEGVYFLDRVRRGVWRLEVYPDAVPVEDPFAMPDRDRIVTRAIHRAWPMTIHLPDLGPSFSVQPIAQPPLPGRTPEPLAGGTRQTAAGQIAAGGTTEAPTRADGGRFLVRPGVYVLAADGPVDRNTLPSRMGGLGFDEYVAPPPDPLPARVFVDAPPQHVAGHPLEIEARVVTATPPDSVTLWIGPGERSWLRPFAMRRTAPYTYLARIPSEHVPEGIYRYVVSVREGKTGITFPGAVHRSPRDWNYGRGDGWRVTVVNPSTPLRLLRPDQDAPRLSFRRIGDGWREGIFQVLPSAATGEAALHLELPVNVEGITPEDYTASLVVKDRIESRGRAIAGATAVRIRARGLGPGQVVHLTLVERDGTGWTAPVALDAGWSERTLPLRDFRVGPAANLPMGFPGHWNYRLEPAVGRGGPGDALRIGEIERLQLSLRREDAGLVGDGLVEAGAWGVEIESVHLVFE